MGLPADKWGAKWISTGRKADKERLPAEYFKRDFSLRGKVKRARLYATACGVYTASINGQRLPSVLAPGTTEYPKRLYYQTYDVTALLQNENTLEFTLMDGWYMGKLGYLNQHNRFGNQRKLLAHLEIEYEDGKTDAINTDESFSCCADGPIRYSDLKDGENYDSRMIPSFSEKAVTVSQDIIPTASPSDGIAEHERFPANLIVTPSGKKVLDFGQNLAGYVCFTVQGKPGQEIRLSLGEVLDHGEFSRATLIEEGRPEIRQEIVFICNGQRQAFHPEGFYSGFRYALVEGLDDIDPADFTAAAVYSDLEFTGSFSCSNEKLNKFHQNTLWSLKSNFVDVPTDCPQREKSGWDGDTQIFTPTACFMAEPAAFFRKWLRDVRDCQRKDGRVANVSPSAHRFQDREPLGGAVGWADAAVMVPYTLWKIYGDERFIAGYLEFTVKGRPGQMFTLRMGEVVKDGHVDLSGIQEQKPTGGWTQTTMLKKLLTGKTPGEAVGTPLQEVRFTCSGGVDHYKTGFAVFGFRYAEIIGEANFENISAIAVYSDMERTGNFQCSDERVNRLLENTLWSMTPASCPHCGGHYMGGSGRPDQHHQPRHHRDAAGLRRI